MKKLTIFALAIFLAACATLQQKQANLATLDASVHSVVSGETSLLAFDATDLQNAKTIFDANFATSGNPYDRAGSQCIGSIIAHLPELNALTAPPAAPKLAAPVTGLFSQLAASQVTREEIAKQAADKLALLRNGIPPDVSIACSYIVTEPAELLRMLVSHGGK